jgi:hypothetical protein
VSLDSLPESEGGQASGVSATAEQAGGAVGIAALYALFHATYVSRLHYLIDTSSLKDLTNKQYEALRAAIVAAEQTGLNPHHFNRALTGYLQPAEKASDRGYAAAFLAVSIIAVIGALVTARLVRKPSADPETERVASVGD